MSATTKKTQKEQKPGFFQSEAWEWIRTIIIAVVIALVIKSFFFDTARVVGSSMVPTLENGDFLLVNKIGYRLGEPEFGDIVILEANAQDEYVKRVIGLPGDTIEVKDQVAYRNGEALDEPYINPGTYPDYPKITVPEGKYFVMGDNRGNSKDSRFADLGPIEKERIESHAIFRYWPFNRGGTL